MSRLCRFAHTCSGCTQLSITYAKQLRDKGVRVRAALAKFADDADAVFADPVASPLTLGYRTSTKLCLHEDSFGQRRIGLYQRDSKTVVDIPQCPVHHPLVNKLIQKLGAGALPAPFYQHGKRSFQAGRLKFLTVRVSPGTGAAGVLVSHTGVDPDALHSWATAHATKQLSIYESLLAKSDETRIVSSAVSLLAGPERLPFAIGKQEFELSPLAFFQANFSLTDAFIKYITADLSGDVLLDLYGGFGAYSFAAAEAFRRIYLVDGNGHAIAAAAAQRQTPANLVAITASVEDFLARHSKLIKDAPQVTHVLVNPPRGGLSAEVPKAFTSPTKFPRLSHLTYVSCSIDTLARDVGAMARSGRWQLRAVQAFDMFPQTDHVEVVAKLSSR